MIKRTISFFMSSFWFLKSESNTYSWDDLLKEGKTSWTGVRNFAARNNLKAMNVGDMGLFYHSGDERTVVGTVEITKTAYPDPTATEGDWVTVDLVPRESLRRGVSLELIKNDPDLRATVLLKQSRLSVSPLTEQEFHRICTLGGLNAL